MSKVLILGATSSIAMEFAKILAQDKNELFLVARNEEKLRSVSKDLEVRGAVIKGTLVQDLSVLSHHAKVVAEAVEKLGQIDTALIAHGILGDQKASEQDFQLALKEIETNFMSVASLASLLANLMEKNKRGCIAVISSVAGDRGRQSNYIYGSAKGGLNIFLQGLRNRLFFSGVQVLTIKPGFVDTPMTAHLPKNALFAPPSKVARGIVQAIAKKKDVVYLPRFWCWILTVIRLVPECIFKRLRL